MVVLPSLSNAVVLLVGLLVTLIGAVDAIWNSDADVLGVFSILLALHVLLLVRIRGGRPAVPLRADLVRWLRARSAVTGEPLEVIADRAVACYRAGLQEEAIPARRHG